MTPQPCLWGRHASLRAHSHAPHPSTPALQAQPHARCGQCQYNPKALSVQKKSWLGHGSVELRHSPALLSVLWGITSGQCYFFHRGRDDIRVTQDHSYPSWSKPILVQPLP